MLEAPAINLPAAALDTFQSAWHARDLKHLPDSVPRWLFLNWLAAQGQLLHGSPRPNLAELVGQEKDYNQPDDFRNTTGVYATSDALWAMMYALRGPDVAQQSDMALQIMQNGEWSPTRYFYSVAPREAGVTDPRTLLAPGFVYVLSPAGFQASPPYDHPGLGHVQEAHWVNPAPVRPLWSMPVTPEDFPLPIRLHDAREVRRRSLSDPWGFPWLDEDRR